MNTAREGEELRLNKYNENIMRPTTRHNVDRCGDGCEGYTPRGYPCRCGCHRTPEEPTS